MRGTDEIGLLTTTRVITGASSIPIQPRLSPAAITGFGLVNYNW